MRLVGRKEATTALTLCTRTDSCVCCKKVTWCLRPDAFFFSFKRGEASGEGVRTSGGLNASSGSTIRAERAVACVVRSRSVARRKLSWKS